MPDTNAPPSIFESDQVSDASGAAAVVVDAIVRWDECVSLVGQPGFDVARVLNEAAHELGKRQVRCVRVAGSVDGGLALRELIAQVLKRTGLGTLTDRDLQAGFEALVEPGPGNHLVALLVADAQTLQPASLRYIQLACRTSPKLRVVLAGQAGLSRHLAAEEFSDLRRRITRKLVLPGGASALSADALPGVPFPPSAPGDRPRAPAWRHVRLGLVALLMLLIGTMVWRHLPQQAESGRPALAVTAKALPEPPPAQPTVSAVSPDPVRPEAGPPLEDTALQAETGTPALDAAEAASPVSPAEPSVAAGPDVAPLEEVPVLVDLVSLQEAELLAAVANASPTSIPDETPAQASPPSAGDAAAVAQASPTLVPNETPAQASPPSAVDAAAVAQASPIPDETWAPDRPSSGSDVADRPLTPQAARSEPPRPPQNRRPPGRAQNAVAQTSPSARPSREASAQAPAAVLTADQRRCREITVRGQLGRTPTESDLEFLRNGCRAK